MLKKLMSLLTSAAVLGTTLVSVAIPSVVSATEETETDTSVQRTVYIRTFETDGDGKEVGYIHNQTTPDEGTLNGKDSTMEAIDYAYEEKDAEGNVTNKAMSMLGSSKYIYYFTEPFDKEDGILHFKWKMKVLNGVNGQNYLDDKYIFISNGAGKTFAFRYWDYKLVWHDDSKWNGREFNAELNVRYGATYDSTTQTWTNGTTKHNGPDVYNTVEGYVDLKNQKMALVSNGSAVAIKDFSSIWSSYDITQIEGLKVYANKGEQIIYDDLFAEKIPGKELSDFFFSMNSFPTLAEGGIDNETFEGNYTDIASLGPDASSEEWTKAMNIGSFKYEFGETFTADTEKTLYLKYSFALDPDVAYSSGDEQAYLALNNTYYHASLYKYNQLRSVHSNWRYYWTNYGSVTTMGATKDDYKYPVEAYIDLSTGKAAVKYGTDGKFQLINVHQDVIDSGISYVQGVGSKQYIDDVTVKKYDGNIYDVAAAQGVDLGVASLPAFFDYENSTADTTVELATTDNTANKAHSVVASGDKISFRDVVKEGKLYIGFDYAEKEYATADATSGSGKRYFNIYNTNGTKYRIAGINGTHAGMQSYYNDWQANTGATTIDRAAGTWNRIDMVIDFDNKIMSGYLNGKLLAQVAMSTSADNDWDGLLANGASSFYIEQEGDGVCCIDNLKITSFTEGFTVDAAMKDNQSIDVDFGTSLTTNELAFYTTAANWNDANITSVTQITPSKLRLTLSSAVADTDTAYHYITIPDFVQNGVKRKAEGVASVVLNDNLICYTNNALNLESTSFTGCDGKTTYPLSVEPGTTAVKLVFNGTVTDANAVTLKQGDTSIGTASCSGNKCTIALTDPLVENKTYTLTFTNGGETYSRTFTTAEGKFVVTDYAFVDANGAETADFTSGGTLKLTVKNTTATPQSVQAIVAGYGEYNRMFKAVPEEVTVEAYKAVVDKEITFDFGDDAASVTLVKALFWNNFEEILPLAERVEVTVETTTVE